MKVVHRVSEARFREHSPNSEPLYFDAHGRILRFSLRPGQSIKEHEVPASPFYVVVLKGHGVFTDGEGREHRVGPDTLLIFDPGENHSVRAEDEDLVFLSFLHGVPGTPPGKEGGTLGRTE